MPRLRSETSPQVTVYDESAVFQAASGATAPLVEFKNSSDAVVGSITANGEINSLILLAVPESKVASHTLTLADKNKIIEMNVGSANDLTVPTNSNAAFPIGTTITVIQTGSGQTTLAPQGGVTINSTPGLKLSTQWSWAKLIKRAENSWVAIGDLSA